MIGLEVSIQGRKLWNLGARYNRLNLVENAKGYNARQSWYTYIAISDSGNDDIANASFPVRRILHIQYYLALVVLCVAVICNAAIGFCCFPYDITCRHTFAIGAKRRINEGGAALWVMRVVHLPVRSLNPSEKWLSGVTTRLA